MREEEVDGMEVRKGRQKDEEHRKGRQRKHDADKIENDKGGNKSYEGTVGEVVLGAGRHGSVHASRSRTFRLALEPSVRDKKKGRKTRKCITPYRPTDSPGSPKRDITHLRVFLALAMSMRARRASRISLTP